MVVFFIVTPQSITIVEEIIVGVISTDFMGAKGMFVVIIVGYVFSSLFVYLMKGKLKIKLPEGFLFGSSSSAWHKQKDGQERKIINVIM